MLKRLQPITRLFTQEERFEFYAMLPISRKSRSLVSVPPFLCGESQNITKIDKRSQESFFENGDNCLISRTKYRGLLEAEKEGERIAVRYSNIYLKFFVSMLIYRHISRQEFALRWLFVPLLLCSRLYPLPPVGFLWLFLGIVPMVSTEGST